MEISVSQQGNLQIKDLNKPIEITSDVGPHIELFERDHGIEMYYQGRIYFIKDGEVNLYSDTGEIDLDATRSSINQD